MQEPEGLGSYPAPRRCPSCRSLAHAWSRVGLTVGPEIFPLSRAEQAAVSVGWRSMRALWLLPSRILITEFLESGLLTPSPVKLFPLTLPFLPGKGVEKVLSINREAGQCPGCGQPWLPLSSRGKNGRHRCSSEMSTRTNLYQEDRTLSNPSKSSQSGYWIFFFLVLYLFFYKYPEVLSGA